MLLCKIILFTMNIITGEKSILNIYLVSLYRYKYFISLKAYQPITMSFYDHSMNYLLNICVLLFLSYQSESLRARQMCGPLCTLPCRQRRRLPACPPPASGGCKGWTCRCNVDPPRRPLTAALCTHVSKPAQTPTSALRLQEELYYLWIDSTTLRSDGHFVWTWSQYRDLSGCIFTTICYQLVQASLSDLPLITSWVKHSFYLACVSSDVCFSNNKYGQTNIIISLYMSVQCLLAWRFLITCGSLEFQILPRINAVFTMGEGNM